MTRPVTRDRFARVCLTEWKSSAKTVSLRPRVFVLAGKSSCKHVPQNAAISGAIPTVLYNIQYNNIIGTTAIFGRSAAVVAIIILLLVRIRRPQARPPPHDY